MTKEMPLYTCHKKVRALEIKAVGEYSYTQEPIPNASLVREVSFVDSAFPPVKLSDKLFQRYVPYPGDFLVTYEDGYQSFSPRQAFLDGYAPAIEDNVLMERLSDLSETPPGTPIPKIPEWLRGMDWAQQIARVAREAYVTIKSLKHQLETRDREKTDNHQS